MKSLNEKFSDEEFNKLQKIKDGLSWHDFIIVAGNCAEEQIKKKKKDID